MLRWHNCCTASAATSWSRINTQTLQPPHIFKGMLTLHQCCLLQARHHIAWQACSFDPIFTIHQCFAHSVQPVICLASASRLNMPTSKRTYQQKPSCGNNEPKVHALVRCIMTGLSDFCQIYSSLSNESIAMLLTLTSDFQQAPT